jgi:hypothetical protein
LAHAPALPPLRWPEEPKPPRWIEGFEVAGADGAAGRADGAAGPVAGVAVGWSVVAGEGRACDENDEPPNVAPLVGAKPAVPARALGSGERRCCAASALVTASPVGRELNRPAANGAACQSPPPKKPREGS